MARATGRLQKGKGSRAVRVCKDRGKQAMGVRADPKREGETVEGTLASSRRLHAKVTRKDVKHL